MIPAPESTGRRMRSSSGVSQLTRRRALKRGGAVQPAAGTGSTVDLHMGCCNISIQSVEEKRSIQIQVGLCICNSGAVAYIAGLPLLVAHLISALVGLRGPSPKLGKVELRAPVGEKKLNVVVSWHLWCRFPIGDKIRVDREMTVIVLRD